MEVPLAVPQRVLAVVVVVAAAVAVVQVLLVAEAVQLVDRGSSNLAVCRTLPMLVCNQAAPPVLLVDLYGLKNGIKGNFHHWQSWLTTWL